MKEKWTPTPDDFNRFLAWLSPDREEAGRKYVEAKQKLISFFTRRGHEEPEYLADVTVDRAIRKLADGELNYSGDPIRDLIGFARHVSQEYKRKPRPDPIEVPDFLQAPDKVDREALFQCKDRCMAQLTERSQNLVTRYYQDQGRKKIINRQQLAQEENFSMPTLRLRVHRILRSVRECFFKCIEKEKAS